MLGNLSFEARETRLYCKIGCWLSGPLCIYIRTWNLNISFVTLMWDILLTLSTFSYARGVPAVRLTLTLFTIQLRLFLKYIIIILNKNKYMT